MHQPMKGIFPDWRNNCFLRTHLNFCWHETCEGIINVTEIFFSFSFVCLFFISFYVVFTPVPAILDKNLEVSKDNIMEKARCKFANNSFLI